MLCSLHVAKFNSLKFYYTNLCMCWLGTNVVYFIIFCLVLVIEQWWPQKTNYELPPVCVETVLSFKWLAEFVSTSKCVFSLKPLNYEFNFQIFVRPFELSVL